MHGRHSLLIHSPGRRAIAGLAAAAFCTAFHAPAGAIPIPADLNLDMVTERPVLNEPGPNPHDALACTDCHEPTKMTYETAVRYGVEIPLITEGDNTVFLCQECHGEGEHFFHPVNFAVKRLADKVAEAKIFPLETLVEGFERLTCLTCHDLHFPNTRRYLLRGFSFIPGEPDGVFTGRIDFCRACHGEEIKTFSGHWEMGDAGDCNLCHLGLREPGVPGPLSRRLNESCTVCHPVPRGTRPHYLDYNPFPDFKRSELAGYGLTLEKGQFTCTTCHAHHRGPEEASFLRPGFVSVVSKSLRVNPHRTTRFCQNCHPFNPPPVGTPEAVAPLWEEDVTRLCRGCHSKEEALKMNHPLSAPRRPGMVPDGWALRKDGSLGCQTCHLDGHGPKDFSNPKMLRAGSFLERNEICFRCHSRGEYAERDIHTEVSEFEGCEFCHIVKERTALRPEGKVGDLLAEPTFLCLLCHNPLPHPASADHTGRFDRHSFVAFDDEITPLTMGKVTCHTCHDAHSPRDEPMFFRSRGEGPIGCQTCHPF